MPPAGSQPSFTEKTMIASNANQKGGMEIVIKLLKFMAWSRTEWGFAAAKMPRGKAIPNDNTIAAVISFRVLMRWDDRTSIAGREYIRENPKSPANAAASQLA